MANKGTVEMSYNRALLGQYKDNVQAEVAQIFEADIKPMAQELTPVEFGTNRRSITTQTERLDNGTLQAEIFTQSGYGGYLELGHKVVGDSGKIVAGRPYIYPSFLKFIPALRQAAKDGWAKLRKF